MASMDLKIVVLGTAGVGKTSVICRYCNGTFIEDTLSTIGAGFFTNTLVIDSVEVTMMLWDTAGEERFRSVAPSLLRGANGIVLCYDLGSLASFEEIDTYMEMFLETCKCDFTEKPIPVLLIGNKADLENRQVPPSVIQEWMRKNNAVLHYEVSAKSGLNITEGFEALLKMLVHPEKVREEPISISLTEGRKGKGKAACCK